MSGTNKRSNKGQFKKKATSKSKSEIGTLVSPTATVPPPSSSPDSADSIQCKTPTTTPTQSTSSSTEPPEQPELDPRTKTLVADVRRQYESVPHKWHTYAKSTLSECGLPQNWNSQFGPEFSKYIDDNCMAEKRVMAIIGFYRQHGISQRINSITRSAVAMTAFEFVIAKIGA